MNGAAKEGGPAYSYRPSLLGAPMEFQLRDGVIAWSSGTRTGRLTLGKVRRVRMSFKPASMQPHRFVTEVWGEGAPRLTIVSSSWKSMVEQERLDAPYAAFVRELHRRIAASKAPVHFIKGQPAWLYWPGLALFIAVALTLIAMMARALDGHTMAGAVFITAFLALLLWQGGNFFRRNRPGSYRPDALPPALLPKG